MSDPTDPGGVGAAQAERVSRTATRVGDTGSPVGSPLTIVLAVIAVVVGFLIFRSIDSGGGSAGELPGIDPGGVVTTTPATVPGETTPGATAAPTTTAAPARVTDGADVIVINAGEVSGSAGDVSDVLKAGGYSMVEPAVSDNDSAEDAETIIFFTEGTTGDIAQQIAQSIARDMGLPATSVQPAPSGGPDIASGDSLGSATVFVMLGTDKAGLTQLAGQSPAAPPLPTTTTTTVA